MAGRSKLGRSAGALCSSSGSGVRGAAGAMVAAAGSRARPCGPDLGLRALIWAWSARVSLATG